MATALLARLPQMATDPEGELLGTLESLLEIVTRAHTVIYEERCRLVDAGRDDEQTRSALNESVKIVFEAAPDAARRAREAAHDRAVKRLLEPDAVPDDPRALLDVIAASERAVRDLLRRQEQIADYLRSCGGSERGS